MWRLLLLMACSAGCAPRVQSPFFGDENYIKVGLDQHAEAKALVSAHAEEGEALALRVLGHDFTALGFMDRDGRPTRARVVTLRGIQLALDPEPAPPLQAAASHAPQPAAASYALIAGPFEATQDADGDGFEEVFVERRTRDQTCLQIYRVRDVGFVDAVPVSVQAFGRELCPSAVVDIDRDGRAELLVRVSFAEFGLKQTPQVSLPLWAADHHFQLHAEPAKLERYLADEQAGRAAELRDARARRDTNTVRRLAVELAALSYVADASTRDQVASLDAAVAGVALRKRERHWLLLAHERITHIWNRPLAAGASAPSLAAPTARR